MEPRVVSESLVLAGVGTAAGVAVGVWATDVLSTLAARSLPRTADIRIDGTVLAFAALLAGLCSLFIGLLPALHLSRHDLHDTLKDGGRQASAGLRAGARDALIAAEVALSVVLLVGAGLLMRSLWNLQGVDPGFAADRVVTMEVSLPVARYEEGTQMPFYARLLERVETLPGVEAVGAINILPLSANYDSRGVQIEDAPKPAGPAASIQARSVTPGYFRAAGVPLVAGRLFEDRDDEHRPLVTVISQSMAERYWPGENVIGKRITFNSGIPEDRQQEVGGPGSREIVGVVGDVKHLGLDEDTVPMFYTPHTQQPSYHTMALVLRAGGDVAPLVDATRRVLSDVDPGVPLYQARRLSDLVGASVAEPRLRALLLAVFAGLALLLASLGVYGVVGYVVSQRWHEMGVRLALGAGDGAVMRLIVGHGMRPVIVGTLVGALGALALSRLLTSMLFGIGAADVVTYGVAGGALLLSALVATVLPARRALRVDPVTALRGD